jgi:hypothetical protein
MGAGARLTDAFRTLSSGRGRREMKAYRWSFFGLAHETHTRNPAPCAEKNPEECPSGRVILLAGV